MKSLSHKLFHATAPVKEMQPIIFEKLMENAVLSRNSDTDYSFTGKHGNYEIMFGFDGETMSVDCFGFMQKDWIELDPTQDQYDSMKKKLESVEFEKEHEPLEYKDPYFENGVNRLYFY